MATLKPKAATKQVPDRYRAYAVDETGKRKALLTGRILIELVEGSVLEIDLSKHSARAGCLMVDGSGKLTLTGHSNRIFIGVEPFKNSKGVA